MRRTWREDSITADSEGNTRNWASVSTGVPLLGNMDGRSYVAYLREGKISFS